jgi:large subunit ribosomal protein L25
MIHEKINVSARTLYGNQAKKLFREGKVPGIVYGNIKEPIAVEFNTAEFSKVYKIAGENHVVDVVLDGKSIPAIIQALDINPLTSKLRNVDFKAVNLKVVTTAEIPVELVGIAPVVKTDAALIVVKMDSIEVEALPEKLPESIIIDISHLTTLDGIIFIKDIIVKGDYKILDDQELPVVVVETETVEVETTETIVADPSTPTA